RGVRAHTRRDRRLDAYVRARAARDHAAPRGEIRRGGAAAAAGMGCLETPMIFVIVFALILASLIALVRGDDAPMLGLSPDQFCQERIWSAIAIALLASLATRFRSRWGEAARNLAVWALILIAFAALYSYRYEMQGFADRVAGELLPGRVSSAAPGE